MTAKRNQAVGAYGEEIAARHLREAGLVILDRNWHCRHGEIDIVARDDSTLVICEVKTRTSVRHGGPFEAVTARKANRLRRLAVCWLEEHQVQPAALRIDVVSVLIPARGAPRVDRVRGVA